MQIVMLFSYGTLVCLHASTGLRSHKYEQSYEAEKPLLHEGNNASMAGGFYFSVSLHGIVNNALFVYSLLVLSVLSLSSWCCSSICVDVLVYMPSQLSSCPSLFTFFSTHHISTNLASTSCLPKYSGYKIAFFFELENLFLPTVR